MLLPLALAGLVAGLALGGPTAPETAQNGGPAQWRDLPSDGLGECGIETGRDGSSSAWAVENGFLHLRLCTAGTPGWTKSGASAGSWTDARYKWRIRTAQTTFLVLLEDASLAGSNGPNTVVSDGMGDLTLIHDINGNGQFSDDWASASPPQYLNNGAGSSRYRRAWSMATGPGQQATMGQVGDIGFAFRNAACGQAIDIWVSTRVIGASSGPICLSWATDPESANLDVRPGCDTGPAEVCVNASDPAKTEVPPTDPPTPIVPTAVPPVITDPPPPSTPTDLPPTATNVPPTATNVPPTATNVPPTATTVPPSATNPPPSATNLPPTATPLVAADTATPVKPSVTPPTNLSTPTTVSASATPPNNLATATPAASATPNSAPETATAVPSWTPIVVTRTPTPDLVPVTPPWGSPTVTPWPTSDFPTPAGPPTPIAGTAGLGICAIDIDPNGQNPRPFPYQVVAHAQLLTPYGAPAAPPISQYTDPQQGSCVTFAGISPGSYRTWLSNVPPTYMLYPGTPQTQTVQCLPSPAQYAQVAFRYTICGYCPPGGVPTPPGPPGAWPTATPIGGGPPPPPPGPPGGGPWKDSPDRPPFGCHSLLPILNFIGNDPVCNSWIEAQNIGDRPAKAIVVIWGAPGFCPPQCTGPLKVECSGLLTPGSAWNFLGAQMPPGAKSGAVISAGIEEIGHGQDIFADALCETLFQFVVGDCNEYRRFWKAVTEHGRWGDFDFGFLPCQPMAVEVLRDCPGDVRPNVTVTSSYTGVAGEFLGAYDPVYGGYAFYAPSLYAGSGGYNSILYIQNGGLECTSLELWFKGHDDCLRPRICDVLTLAPGETFQFDVSSCLPAGWVGNAWIRSTQPLAVAVDHAGNDVLMTYTGMPSELNYSWDGQAFFTTGSAVAYGPLIYSEYQGWDTAITVQNMSRTSAAKVKVYFLDRSGDVITTVVDWLCAQGAQQFFLPVVAGLPGNWIGSVRVESQDWFAPGSNPVAAPNIFGVAELVKYTDVMRTEPQEAIAYDLFPEQMAYDWQVGSFCGGLCSGIGRIGIPSFHKDQVGTGVTSEVAIANLVPAPGFTDFAVFLFDQNGLLDYVCEKLHSRQVEYIDLATWGFVNPGFKGSAIISATFWEHEVWAGDGQFVRNVVGLAAVKVERSGAVLGSQVPGDESSGNIGFPMPGPAPCNCMPAPRCPGQPSFGGGGGGGGAQPTLPPPPPPPGPPIP
jgi:hypothetical protein